MVPAKKQQKKKCLTTKASSTAADIESILGSSGMAKKKLVADPAPAPPTASHPEPVSEATPITAEAGKFKELFADANEIATLADDTPRAAFDLSKNPHLSDDDSIGDLVRDTRGRAPRQTAVLDGQVCRIYTPQELKLGQGGNTPLCPFDCDCCF